ncbi:MAG: AGE family epimerase/isomerase [Defluviitaleaceae bacterium]|nr:AGE family epimerase/isomerase [Defluviitaleaceae bacterium]
MPSHLTEQEIKLLTFAQHDLTHNLLPWWTTHAPDNINGGFHGEIAADNTPNPHAERFLVLYARLLWTFSAAYEVTRDDNHKTLATRAYDYLTQHFHDPIHGGFFLYVAPAGTVTNDRKYTYGNAFAVYGLAEYARVFSHAPAKELAQQTAALLDAKMWDAPHMGYFEIGDRAWHYLPHITMHGNGVESQKTMNTHLHVLEAYANLLRIADTPLIRHRVRTLLHLFADRIINRASHHFHYYQARDWTVTDPNYSVGHDLEGSWLLHEAALILNEPETTATIRPLCINMARAGYDIARSPDGGIYTEYNVLTQTPSPQFSWWEQAEGVVAFLHAYHQTQEDKFLQAATDTLAFIQAHFIDRTHGGWHIFPPTSGKPFPLKASPYYCPYHNARMSIEIIHRLGGTRP